MSAPVEFFVYTAWFERRRASSNGTTFLSVYIENIWYEFMASLLPFKDNLIESRWKVEQKNEASCLAKRNVLFYCQNCMNGVCHVCFLVFPAYQLLFYELLIRWTSIKKTRFLATLIDNPPSISPLINIQSHKVKTWFSVRGDQHST